MWILLRLRFVNLLHFAITRKHSVPFSKSSAQIYGKIIAHQAAKLNVYQYTTAISHVYTYVVT